MTAADLFTQANEAFFEDDYDEALSLYSQAIDAEPENPEFYLKRYTWIYFIQIQRTDQTKARTVWFQVHSLRKTQEKWIGSQGCKQGSGNLAIKSRISHSTC